MKKTNKKYLAFSIIGLFALALVSAALVGYIANTVHTDVTVSAPIQQWISETSGTGWTDSITFTGIYAGESIITYGKSQNLASVPITGETNFIVTNTGITCEDFESVVVDMNIGGAGWTGPIPILDCCCNVVDVNTVEFVSGVPASWVAGQVDLTKTVVIFKTGAEGTYTFTSSITPTA